MNGAGQKGEKTGQRLILLLVVALVAFSSAMKELNQLQQFGVDATRLLAQLSDTFVPSEHPQAVVKVEKVETCESYQTLAQSAASVELPWLSRSPELMEPNAIPPVPQIELRKAQRPRTAEPQIARLKRVPPVAVDPFELEVRILMDQDAEANALIPPDLPVTLFKAKPRKHSAVKLNPREREVFLKTLTRSINLRIAG